jgi:hypothetical protein
MKYLVVIVSFFIALYSCQTTGKKENQPNELIEKFKPFLHGTWVPVDYINDIVKTKSPLKSSGLGLISEFSIDAAAIKEDSLHVGASFGNHEGGEFILYFQQGQTPTSLLTNLSADEKEPDLYELGYSINKHDTSLVLYHYSQKNKRLLDKTEYIKAPMNDSKNEGDASGLQYMVNQKLVSGTYKVTDSTGVETQVELTNEGKITGFPGFKTYYILTDFVADPENITDEICFDIQTKNQKCYGFKIVADTINLFEPAKDEQDILFKPGPTIYKFVRQK